MTSKNSVAKQALAILTEVHPHEGVLSTKEVKTRFGASERVARVVNRVTRGVLDIEVVRAEADGEIATGTVSPQNNASGSPATGAKAPGGRASRDTDAVGGEGPDESGTHTELPGERHLFEWRQDGIERAVVLTEDEMRGIIREYVDRAQGGMGHTMQQVAVKHRMTRRDFHKIKSLYGLTKQHEPFTRGEMAERPVDDLATEQLALKRQQLAQRVEREDIAQLRRLSGKWVAFEEGVLDPFEDLLRRVLGRVPPIGDEQPWATPGRRARPWIFFYQGSDLHFGLKVDERLSLGGEIYNRDIAASRWHEGLDEALEHGCAAFGRDNLDYALIGVGGDIAHVDNIHALTSSMRHHQDMDGLPQTLVQDIVERIYIPAVDRLLAQDIPVHLIAIPGNHDELLSRAFMTALWAAFRNDARVTFGNMAASHAFHLYGRTLLVGHHGHGERKATDLASTADVWLRDRDESAKYRYALTGNLHHFDVEEEDGIILIQQPSPAASDVYHAQNGFDKSRAATVAVYFSPTKGLLDLRYIGW